MYKIVSHTKKHIKMPICTQRQNNWGAKPAWHLVASIEHNLDWYGYWTKCLASRKRKIKLLHLCASGYAQQWYSGRWKWRKSWRNSSSCLGKIDRYFPLHQDRWSCTAPADPLGWFHNKFIKTSKWQNSDISNFSTHSHTYREMQAMVGLGGAAPVASIALPAPVRRQENLGLTCQQSITVSLNHPVVWDQTETNTDL